MGRVMFKGGNEGTCLEWDGGGMLRMDLMVWEVLF
jgi:hypothetical protein